MEAISLRMIISIVVGGGLGFAYYKFIGCRTGACPLTGNPYIATIYGGFLGYLLSAS